MTAPEGEQAGEETTTVSRGHGLIAGLAAFVAGTAKALEEEGVSRAQRLQALPTAAKALAVASGMSVIMGGIVYILITQTGIMQVKPDTEVSSLHNAISVAEDQRALVKEHFQKRIGVWQKDEKKVQKAS